MATGSGFANQLKSFWRSTVGNTGIMYALAAVPVFLAVGAGVDFARYNSLKTEVQAAIDAAALAGAAAAGKSESVRLAEAKAAFDGNIAKGEADGLEISEDFRVEDGKLKAFASVKMPTSFMVLAGISDMSVDASAEVGIMSQKQAEVVLVLDYSGSMNDVSGTKVKYIAMRDAAISLVEDLSKANPHKLKIGLVPFSHHVYTTLDKNHVLGGSKKSDWTGCTQDRPYPANMTDAAPGSDPNTKWGQPFAPEHANWGCSGYQSNDLKIVPLTDDFNKIKSQLNKMKPYAWTHIALGVEFGMHLLSPSSTFPGGAAWDDENTQKFLVVLTDGMQTEPAFGPGGVRTVEQGEKNLEELCKVVKGNGTTMITLAFDLDDSVTRRRLAQCASSSADAFVADDDTDLSKAFELIKTAIAQDIYLSR